jgi:hypothetical protein
MSARAFEEACHTLPAQTFHGISPHAVFLASALEIGAAAKHDLKQAETKHEAAVENANVLVERTKSSVTASMQALASFRAAMAQAPDKAPFLALAEDIGAHSEQFRQWWPEHDVRRFVDFSVSFSVFFKNRLY